MSRHSGSERLSGPEEARISPNEALVLENSVEVCKDSLRHLKGSLLFLRNSFAARCNDTRVSKVCTKKAYFPHGCGIFFGDALRNNTYVSSLALYVDTFISSLFDREEIKPMQMFIKSSTALRSLQLNGTDGMGHVCPVSYLLFWLQQRIHELNIFIEMTGCPHKDFIVGYQKPTL